MKGKKKAAAQAETTLFERYTDMRRRLAEMQSEVRKIRKQIPAALDAEGYDMGADTRLFLKQTVLQTLKQLQFELEPTPEMEQLPALAQLVVRV